jgi:hypothetical protein
MVVNRRNATELVKQWTNLYGISDKPSQIIPRFTANKSIERRSHVDSLGKEVVVYYRLKGVGHALPVDPGKCETKGGRMKPFSSDKNFFSTYWVAVDFGLIPKAEILGPKQVEYLQKGVQFSVVNTNSSNFLWSVSKGCTIVSGQGTNTVTVNWGNENGYVNVVQLDGEKCRKSYSTLAVEVIK